MCPATFVDAACGEFPDRFARTLKGFITAGTHPNTFGVVLLSLGCQQTNPEEVAEAIRKTRPPRGKHQHPVRRRRDEGHWPTVSRLSTS